jgi:flagellar L-ring protein precursor FlgH
MILLAALALVLVALVAVAEAQDEPSSVMARTMAQNIEDASLEANGPTAGAASSMFLIEPPRPREFRRHDLVQIIVRETTRTKRKNNLDTEKQWDIDASIGDFPSIQLEDLLQFQLQPGTTPPIDLSIDSDTNFETDGEQKHQEDVTSRITAEVIDILPNGNLVLEGRTIICIDTEESVIKMTGIGRPEDVTPVNTILSTQLHEFTWERKTSGEMKKSSEKGIITRFFEAMFWF